MSETMTVQDMEKVLTDSSTSIETFTKIRKQVFCRDAVRSSLRSIMSDYDTFAKQFTNKNEATERQGIAYWMLGESNRAIDILETTKENDHHNYFLAKSFLDLCEYSLAHEYIEPYLKNHPSDIMGTCILLASKIGLGLYSDADSVLNATGKKSQESPDIFYLKGLNLDLQGHHEEANTEYEKALNLDSEHPGALFRLASNNDLLGNDEEAMVLYERLTKMRPAHINALMNLGIMHEDNNNYDKAIKCYESILEYNPNHRRARLFLADAEASKSMYYDEDSTKRELKMQKLYLSSIDELNLGSRVQDGLKSLGVKTVGELILKSEDDLLDLSNFGKTSLNEIKEVLRSKGLTLHQDKESKIILEETTSNIDEEILNKPLAEFEWSGRIRKMFDRLNIITIHDLIQKSENDIMESKNLGMTSINEIREKLNPLGVKLRKE